MKIDGAYKINAPRETVWRALLDPAVLKQTIPGCEELTATGENRYRATVKAGVGAIKGTFASDFAISEIDEGKGYTLSSKAKAPVGFVEGNGRVQLADDGAQSTTITFSGDVKMGGALASIAGRLFEAAAKKNTDDMFANLRRLVESR
jgi:carbon monoxide dehydrogenase subunit G